jgi:repressor LexA
MFNRDKFALILKKISETYENQRDFAKKSDINRTYLSQYMNMKLEEPPKPVILQKLADASNSITNYEELMQVCGYFDNTMESTVFGYYNTLKNFQKNITTLDKKSNYEVEATVDSFQKYLLDLCENLLNSDDLPIKLDKYYNLAYLVEDYSYISGFLLMYDCLLKSLKDENFIEIIKYNFIDWFDLDAIYNNLNKIENLELLSYNSETIKININKNLDIIIKYIEEFCNCLSLSFLSDFDSNALTDLFKKKVSKEKNIKSIADNDKEKQYYMCPVYGQISAGQPNWADECIEGRIPLDTDLMGIVNPEEHFFLRVNGESMNKVIRNGAFALIHRQDMVNDGEIAVVLVNGYDATLKKFTRQGDMIILEPQTTDASIKTQVYDKTTPIKILGKYVGKMEIDK